MKLACMLLLLCVTCCSAQTYTVLHNFTDNQDGAGPYGTVTFDGRGNLYGTTQYSLERGKTVDGAIYKIDASGNESILHYFTNPDGLSPDSDLLLDSAGFLYGTCPSGGPASYGTIFRVNAQTGVLQVLFAWTDPTTQGQCAGPCPGLTRVGTTLYGTGKLGGPQNKGVVFKLDSSGNYTVMHFFTGTNGDGSQPTGKLLLASDGNLYGTTSQGGASQYGTIFKINPKTGAETILHSFDLLDGDFPTGQLLQDAQGNFYGVTELGGTIGDGVIYKLASDGTFTVLYNFAGSPNSGAAPLAGVIQDKAGNLYGTTSGGGTGGYTGTIYKLDTNGIFTVEHNFDVPTGYWPTAPLKSDTAGNLYGTTDFGGTGCSGCGTVYEFTP